MVKRVLVIDEHDAARAPMAEGMLNHLFAGRLDVRSAGSDPSEELNRYAVQVMDEVGIDISFITPKPISEFEGQDFDYVITLCDTAAQSCPEFPGKNVRFHWPYTNPATTDAGENRNIQRFRMLRDEMQIQMEEYFRRVLN